MYWSLPIIIHHNLGRKQAKRNAPTRVHTASAEIEVFDLFGEVGMPEESRILVIGAIAIKRPLR